MKIFIAFVLSFIVLKGAYAQPDWNTDQLALIDRMKELSASMRVDGGGGEAYGGILADGFTRWTVGSTTINEREGWIDGIAEWFDAGWRVIDGSLEVLEIDIHGNIATTRRVVRESFKSPEGDITTYESGVVEVWEKSKDGGQWLLRRASVTSKLVEED